MLQLLLSVSLIIAQSSASQADQRSDAIAVVDQKALQADSMMAMRIKEPIPAATIKKGKKVKTRLRPGLYKNKRRRRGQPLTPEQVQKTKRRAINRCNKFTQKIKQRRLRHVAQLVNLRQRLRSLKKLKMKIARKEARLRKSSQKLQRTINRESVLISSINRISRKVAIKSVPFKRPAKAAIRRAIINASRRMSLKRSPKMGYKLRKALSSSAAEDEKPRQKEVRIKNFRGVTGRMSHSEDSDHDGEAPRDLVPRHTSDYSTQEYWDWRYEQEAKSGDVRHYDWILTYDLLRPHLLPYIKQTDKILLVGCGNSKLSEELYADGFEGLLNTDYSEGIIKMMAERTRDTYPNMKWAVADMRHLDDIEDGFYDVVIDKCAMDAIWSDGGSLWDPKEETVRDITLSVQEFYRVLRPGGTFLFVSFGQPHFRKPLLSIPGWEIKTVEIGMYFLYVMHK